MQSCPCGNNQSYSLCCGKFISGQQIPSTAEELMRSRYSAYHQHQFDYIADTMRPPASDHFDVEDAKNSELDMQWVKLEVVKSTRDTVEFRAHYLLDGQDYVLHEISEFKQINGKWYYVNGTHSDNKSNTSKVGRNDPCPCNSGKKYKKCCG